MMGVGQSFNWEIAGKCTELSTILSGMDVSFLRLLLKKTSGWQNKNDEFLDATTVVFICRKK